jgi:hypothetical protein
MDNMLFMLLDKFPVFLVSLTATNIWIFHLKFKLSTSWTFFCNVESMRICSLISLVISGTFFCEHFLLKEFRTSINLLLILRSNV